MAAAGAYRYGDRLVPLAVLLLVLATVCVVLAADVDKDYASQAKALAPDDIQGHLKLAEWCKERQQWALVCDQCAQILRQNPNHEQAKLLLELAKAELARKQPAPTASRPAGAPRAAELPRVITDKEVQILRRKELSKPDVPERVTVKISKDVIERFAQERFGANRQGRTQFMRLSPAAKAQVMLASSLADRFAAEIEITSDPLFFAEFEKQVLPVVTKGCATAQCHGGPEARGFRLFTGRKLTTNEVYTNYLILNDYKKDPQGKLRLLNRDTRSHSLILRYGLRGAPTGELAPAPHPVAIEPMYRGVRDPRYLQVYAWINSLRLLYPDYGIDIRSASKPE